MSGLLRHLWRLRCLRRLRSGIHWIAETLRVLLLARYLTRLSSSLGKSFHARVVNELPLVIVILSANLFYRFLGAQAGHTNDGPAAEGGVGSGG